MKNVRKAKVTDEHREEARRLRMIWDSTTHATQAAFGEKYGIGSQSSVGQFLNGIVPLSLKSASGFAQGLGCQIADFSPRLAAIAGAFINSLNSPQRSLERRGVQELDESKIETALNPGLIWVVGRDERGQLPEKVWNGEAKPAGTTGGFALLGMAEPFAFVTEVQGLNMVPRFMPGEYILVEPQTAPLIEDDVLVRLKTGKSLLRKLASDWTQDPIQLTSYNDASVLKINAVDISWFFHVAHALPRRKVFNP